MNDQSSVPAAVLPRYVPYASGVFRMAMGLMALDADEWIEPDDRRGEQLRLKDELLATRHGAVFAMLPDSLPAQREVLAMLLAHLPRRHPGLVEVDGDAVAVPAAGRSYRLSDFAAAPLDLAGRLVQEDLCLMAPGEAGYVLEAASLCFPARWLLAEKMGRPMLEIHEKVPGYAESLGRPVDRFFQHLAVERPVMRVNWSISESDELYQVAGKFRTDANPDITGANAGERLWVRVERQTLRRLPESGRILFTIKTHLDPMAVLAAQPRHAAALAGAIRTLPEGMQRYKSAARWSEAALAWLDRAAGDAAV